MLTQTMPAKCPLQQNNHHWKNGVQPSSTTPEPCRIFSTENWSCWCLMMTHNFTKTLCCCCFCTLISFNTSVSISSFVFFLLYECIFCLLKWTLHDYNMSLSSKLGAQLKKTTRSQFYNCQIYISLRSEPRLQLPNPQREPYLRKYLCCSLYQWNKVRPRGCMDNYYPLTIKSQVISELVS